MHLDIEIDTREGIEILRAKGRLTVGEPVTKLREVITGFAGEQKTNIILNLEHVDYIDSTGLGGMVICFTALQKEGGALKLVHLNRRNIELLVLTKLSTVFETFNDEQDAVNSFFPNREIKKFDILNFLNEQQKDESPS